MDQEMPVLGESYTMSVEKSRSSFPLTGFAVLDGNAATRAIRELERGGSVAHTPILGVTANVREEQKADMMSAGMDDVMSKPYGIDKMIHRILGLIEDGEG